MRIGIIGYGYWGPNLLRNFRSLPDCAITVVCDLLPERLAEAAQACPGIRVTTRAEEVFVAPDVDAVVVAVPPSLHHAMACQALGNGKHVLVEKPMALRLRDAKEMAALAQRTGRFLMVDHTLLYSGAVATLKGIVEDGSLGRLSYFDSTRVNLGIFRNDCNVLWDLAPHDLSILSYLVRERPSSVNAVGACHTGNGFEDVAYLTLNFDSGLIAHLRCSTAWPVKVRSLWIGGNRGMVEFDDLREREALRVHEVGWGTQDDGSCKAPRGPNGPPRVPAHGTKEALLSMAEDFLACARTGRRPVADLDSALEGIRILEAAQVSLRKGGREVAIGGPDTDEADRAWKRSTSMTADRS